MNNFCIDTIEVILSDCRNTAAAKQCVNSSCIDTTEVILSDCRNTAAAKQCATNSCIDTTEVILSDCCNTTEGQALKQCDSFFRRSGRWSLTGDSH